MNHDFLSQLSSALRARAVSAQPSVAAIRLTPERHLSGTLWQPDALVTSEQSLPQRDAFTLLLPDGTTVEASVAGRDRGTNIAVLRLPHPVPSAPRLVLAADVRPGALVLAIGADGAGGVAVRAGVVNVAGSEWTSATGGRIDQRIELDVRLAEAEEGGPIFDAQGACVGMSTFGPRGKVLAIPAATVERIVPRLLSEGRIARGWLGVALRPVSVPDALRDAAGQPSGLMVMSLATDGPAAKAGIVAGDIVLSVDGVPARRLRRIAAHLASDSVGRKADVRVIRSGAVIALQAQIEARPAT